MEPDSTVPVVESKRDARIERIKHLLDQGWSAERIAGDTGLSAPGVRKICKDLGLKKNKAPRVEDPGDKAQSETHRKIGLRFYNYSVERVRSSTQVADEIGWSPQKIASIVKGTYNLTLVDIQRMATYMKKTLAELMEGL